MLLILWWCCCFTSPAFANDEQATVASNSGVNNPTPYSGEGIPSVKGPRPEGKTGPFASLGDMLDARGINYQGLFLAAGFENMSTGTRLGHFGAQGIFINAVDLDLNKLASIRGAKIHIEGVIFPFTYPTASGTNFGTFSSSYLGSDQYPSHATGAPWLSLLTWEQTVFDDRLNFEVGKTNMQRYFFGPNCGLDFLCTDSLVKWDGGVPDASLGTLGARVKYNVTPLLSLEAGIQQLRDYATQISRNGWDITSVDGGQGAFMVGGIGYHTDFSNSPYPSDIHIDYYYADTEITDPYTSVGGHSIVITGEPAASHRGSAGIVLKMRKTIWSETGALASTPDLLPRNLTFFSTIERSFDSSRPIAWGLTAGLTLTKPFSHRWSWLQVDQINFKTMYDRLNRSTLLAQRDTRVLLGGTNATTSPNEARFELSATFGLGRYVKIEPAVEYILNPDSSMSPASPYMPRSGWLAGATIAISIGNPHR
ncbi:carbohydrate porin [Burkholderia pseudomultivorans]|uniref:carbohydrate porin n=1 Tax=Burkholderia pseudomultivorans TaxID=1207504 RepID=UPI002876C876|nr:carbohydrate porin [Burkholderia pseudomultivorans]MDS0862957.1 carbohydrate porin [Burkholderia pseudomultivorans]